MTSPLIKKWLSRSVTNDSTYPPKLRRVLRSTFCDMCLSDRLHTIIDADKVLVLRDGEAFEFDHPYILLTRQIGSEMSGLRQEESVGYAEERSGENAESRQLGIFKDMVMETGPLVTEHLWHMAKQSWEHNEKDRKVQQKG